MRYLIIAPEHDPFYSKWYEYENHYVDGMIVADLEFDMFTANGKDWIEIEEDHL